MDFGHFRETYFSTNFRPFLGISTFFQKIRSGPLTLARQGSILAGAPTVPLEDTIGVVSLGISHPTQISYSPAPHQEGIENMENPDCPRTSLW